jgi:hypothetical protein
VSFQRPEGRWFRWGPRAAPSGCSNTREHRDGGGQYANRSKIPPSRIRAQHGAAGVSVSIAEKGPDKTRNGSARQGLGCSSGPARSIPGRSYMARRLVRVQPAFAGSRSHVVLGDGSSGGASRTAIVAVVDAVAREPAQAVPAACSDGAVTESPGCDRRPEWAGRRRPPRLFGVLRRPVSTSSCGNRSRGAMT